MGCGCHHRGVYRRERVLNVRQLLLTDTLPVLNLLLGASVTEFLIGFALVCGVFAAEYLNTALERLIDTRFPEITADNKFIKDTAAAGVFIISIAFFLSQGLILLPKLLEVIS